MASEFGKETSVDALVSVTTSRHRRISPLKRRQRFIYACIAAGVLSSLLAISTFWLIHKADQIRSSLTLSSTLMSRLQSQVLGGDSSAVRTIFADLQQQTSLARDASRDPLWRAAGHLPILGANFSAITEVAVSADDVVSRAIAPLLGELGTLDPKNLAPVEGRVDLAPIEEVQPRLSAAANTVQLSYERLSRIDNTGLLPMVSEPLEKATKALGDANDAVQYAASTAEILPKMLGGDGQRRHLVLIQNNAEIRATGGIPGALAVISANEGEIKLAEQGSATEMGRFDPAIITAPEQASIYTSRMGRFMQSVNLTPDFPTAAQTAAEMWETRKDQTTIDGVIALDPVALSHIIRATGPVQLTFEDPVAGEVLALSGLPTSLTAENVVPTLLSDVYAAIEEPRLQDAYFAAVASEVFEVLSSGAADSSNLVQALVQGANEGRLYVWSAHKEEQAIIASTGIAGNVTGTGAGGAAFGAYFNDGTAAKMDYYVRRTVQLHQTCTSEGYLQYTLTTTLTNTAPMDAAESLPAYVTGGGEFGVPAGTVQTNFIGYGPDQSRLQTARINGKSAQLGSYRHGDRPVGVLTAKLAPGESATLELEFTNVVQQSVPVLDITPTIQPLNEVELPLEAGGACS